MVTVSPYREAWGQIPVTGKTPYPMLPSNSAGHSWGTARERSGRKVGTTADRYAPYALGYTHATVAGTKRAEPARGRKSQKAGRGADCSLQLDCMKVEPIVIADQQAAVNTFSGLPQIAGRVRQRRIG